MTGARRLTGTPAVTSARFELGGVEALEAHVEAVRTQLLGMCAGKVGDGPGEGVRVGAGDGDGLAELIGAEELVDPPFGAHRAVGDDADSRAQALDLAEEVGADEDRDAFGEGEGAQQLSDLGHAPRVEAVGGLVQHQELRATQECPGDTEALTHAERIGARPILAALAQADDLEHPGDLAGDAAAGHPGVDRSVCEVGLAAAPAVEGGRLDDGTDVAPGGHAALAEDLDAAFAATDEVEDAAHGGGLASTVWAEKAVDVTREDLEIEVANRGPAAVEAGQRPRAERDASSDIFGHGTPAWRVVITMHAGGQMVARILGVALALVGFGAACEYAPCDEYVDYVCTCHADDPSLRL